jgi:hypothetical protein
VQVRRSALQAARLPAKHGWEPASVLGVLYGCLGSQVVQHR